MGIFKNIFLNNKFISFKEAIAILESEEDNVEKQEIPSFYFKYEDEIYGADESSRLIFARMKNPEKQDKQASKLGSFLAKNMKTKTERVFGFEDIKKIKVISEEEAIKKQ